MAMAVDSRQQSQLNGMSYDPLRYPQPHFTNPWVSAAGTSQQQLYQTSIAPTVSAGLENHASSQPQAIQRPTSIAIPYHGLPVTAPSLGSDLLSRSYTSGYGTSAAATTNTLSSQPQRSSFSDALDASRGMVSLSQSDITPRNIYGTQGSSRSSTDSYGFPSTHSAHSSISGASYNGTNYYGGEGSVTDYSSAFEKPAVARADEGWWDIWDEPQVFSMEDLIVPTTSCHGFQPLVTPSSPKNQSSPDGNTNEEVIKQLRELAEADGGGGQIAPREEAEQAPHQLPAWTPSQYIAAENANFGTENSYEVTTMPTPGYENGGWNNNGYHALNDACKTEYEHDQAPVSSAEACLSSFVQISELCPDMSNGSTMDDSHQANPGIGMPVQAFPKRGGFDVVAGPERDIVISRYKEKRRTRRFDKQVRYESRKARADSRLRIKGRFAKANQI